MTREHDEEYVASEHEGLVGPGGAIDRDALFALYEEQAAREDEAPVTVTFRLLRDLDKRLDRYLVDRVPFLSRTQIQKLIEEAAVTVNGRVPKSSTHLRKGDTVVATLPPPPSGAIAPEDIPLDVLFEDDHLIVVNKPAGLIVHPARAHKSGTLVNALAWRFRHVSGGALSAIGKELARPGIVHRLDKFTSGCLVAAKVDTAHWRLGKQFERRETAKRYLAVVHGEVTPETETVDLPLGKHPTVREKYAVRQDDAGKPSRTTWRVREVYAGFTLVELELHTGRTHQIRVHLSHRGYPILGDDLYGGKHASERDLLAADDPTRDAAPTAPLLARQCLHAATLGFRHPMDGTPMTFTAPLPEDFRRAVALLRRSLRRAITPAGATLELAELLGE